MFGLKVSEIEKLARREIQLADRKRALTAAIDVAEREAGEAILEGAAEPELAKVIALKGQRDALVVAMRTLREKRSDAIRAQYREQAAALREVSRKKSVELDSAKSKLADLMRQVSETEGAPMIYVQDGLAPLAPITIPRTVTLEQEIATAQREADVFETKSVPAAGILDIEATSNAQALEALLQHPAEIPSLDAVERWLDGCQAAARQPFGDLPRRVYLVWGKDQVIDLDASYVFVNGLAERTVLQLPYKFVDHHQPSERRAAEKAAAEAAQTEHVDVASGTFKAVA